MPQCLGSHAFRPQRKISSFFRNEMQRFEFASVYMGNLFKIVKTLGVEKKQWLQILGSVLDCKCPYGFSWKSWHKAHLKGNKVNNDATSRQSVLGIFECLSKHLWICLEVFKMSKRKKWWTYFFSQADLFLLAWLYFSKLVDRAGWCFLLAFFWVMLVLHNPYIAIQNSHSLYSLNEDQASWRAL